MSCRFFHTDTLTFIPKSIIHLLSKHCGHFVRHWGTATSRTSRQESHSDGEEEPLTHRMSCGPEGHLIFQTGKVAREWCSLFSKLPLLGEVVSFLHQPGSPASCTGGRLSMAPN